MADDRSEVYRAMDLSLRIGEILLASGAGAADVNATILAVTSACGLRNCVFDISFTTLTVTYQENPDTPPETHMRVVQFRTLDYGSLAKADVIVRELAAGRIDRAEASAQVNEIQSSRSTYPRQLQIVASGAMASGVALVFGGKVIVTAMAFLMACAIEVMGRTLQRRRIPDFYQRAFGALIAIGAALIVHVMDVPAEPSVVVASGIIVLLAGISLVGAVQDALTGYYVTGAARTFEAVLLTGAVIAGVSMGITVGRNFGADLKISSAVTTFEDLPLQLVGTVITCIGFAVLVHVPWRALAPLALVGLIAQLTYQLCVGAKLGPSISSAIAAFGVGLIAFEVGRRVHIPPLVVVTVSIISMLPGLTIYRGLYLMLVDQNVYGVIELLTAITIAVGLASGAILGEYVAQPLAREARRFENRMAGPRLVGPLRQPSRRTTRRAVRRLRRQLEQGEE